MQFQYNADYPDRFYTSNNTNTAAATTSSSSFIQIANYDAKDPYHFPPVEPISCARITSRVYDPISQSISTIPNVLVKTTLLVPSLSQQTQSQPTMSQVSQPSSSSRRGSTTSNRLSVQNFNTTNTMMNSNFQMSDDDDDMESSSSDFSSDTSLDQVNAMLHENDTDTENNEIDFINNPNNIAYWIQDTIREAIYGRVYKAIVLRRMPYKYKQYIIQQQTMKLQSVQSTQSSTQSSLLSIQQISNVEWEITTHDCAVKEMSWQHIRRERDRLAEDPVKEVCAMQFFKVWYNSVLPSPMNHIHPSTTPTTITNTNIAMTTQQQQQQYNISPIPTTMSVVDAMTPMETPTNNTISSSSSSDVVVTSFQQMIKTNVMMPLDLLSDERHLYSIMPYCNGGELFDLLNMNDRFTENEARYWMKQVLNGIECLQHSGICHRDMSLENLLVHESGVLIIDMGMCLRIPHDDTDHVRNTDLSQQQQHVHDIVPSVKNLRRYMMKPQGICGKWHYMSPEVHNNTAPFDGYAVDMWAAGVILFLMLTGYPPWDRPSPTDERFKYMSAGYLVQMLTEWETGLSPDAMDLLQRMMFLDPKDRLSLDQVRAHPWMVNGQCDPPPSLSQRNIYS